eukprot:4579-Heterococcus_DN1.PRE.2
MYCLTADVRTVIAFEAAHTNLEAAHNFTADSQCLQSFPETRCEFLHQVAEAAAADTEGAAKLLVYNSEQAHDQIRGATPAGTREEALTGKYNEHVYGCFDQKLFHIVHNKKFSKKYKTSPVLLSQLWGANCVTIETASQLTSDAPCLQYIPSDARSEFLSLVATEVARAAEAARIAI